MDHPGGEAQASRLLRGMRLSAEQWSIEEERSQPSDTVAAEGQARPPVEGLPGSEGCENGGRIRASARGWGATAGPAAPEGMLPSDLEKEEETREGFMQRVVREVSGAVAHLFRPGDAALVSAGPLFESAVGGAEGESSEWTVALEYHQPRTIPGVGQPGEMPASHGGGDVSRDVVMLNDVVKEVGRQLRDPSSALRKIGALAHVRVRCFYRTMERHSFVLLSRVFDEWHGQTRVPGEGRADSRTLAMLHTFLRQQSSDQRAIALQTRELAQQVSGVGALVCFCLSACGVSVPSGARARGNRFRFPFGGQWCSRASLRARLCHFLMACPVLCLLAHGARSMCYNAST